MEKIRNQLEVLYHWQFVSLTIFIIAFVISGCGASKNVKVAQSPAQQAYLVQKPILVRTSAHDQQRPQWTKKTVVEEDGNIYFSGAFLNGSDYSVTIRCANAEALKVVVQAISNFVRVEFSEHVQGSNTGTDGVDRWVSDGIATIADNLHLLGVRQKEVYYEELYDPTINASIYNVFVKLEIPKIDFLNAKAEAVRRLRDKFASAGEMEAKEKAEKLLEELKSEISKSA
ncbi:hypothetical protein ACFL03_07815 [Thermodesulfobacteriota bacterium]